MTSILVGVDGDLAGEQALKWAARQAERSSASLTLMTVLDPSVLRQAGSVEEEARQLAEKMLQEKCNALAGPYPTVKTEISVVKGKVVDALVDAADTHDLIVLGTHRGASVSETFGGATALRVSVSTVVPTMVVPVDWNPGDEGTGIMVGVGPDNVSEKAIDFAVSEALARDEEVELVAMWGLPAFLTRPAEVMGGGIAPVGEQRQFEMDNRVAELKEKNPELQVSGYAVEAPAPARGLAERSADYRMLVLGTHSRTAMGRTLFGSVTHGVLLNLKVPTVIVPAAD